MAYGSQNMPAATGQEAGRPQAQTTIEAAGGPFIRHSQAGRAPQYTVSGTAFGGVITQPLVARPGYFRNLRVNHTLVTGGTITSGTIQADAPYNVNSLIQLKDAFGTPLITADGYSVSNLLQIFSGGFGVNNFTNAPSNLPSWSSVSNTTGAGSFSYALPLEFSKAYGVISAANASLLPTLQFNLNSATAVFGSGSSGSYPTISTTVDSDFYWLPEGVAVEPPGLGTTRQWVLQQLNPTVASAGSARLQLPRLGGYLDNLIFISRDSTGARADILPTSNNRLQLYVDGVPLIDTTTNELYDDMAIQYGLSTASTTGISGVNRPTGTFAFSRKTSLNQQSLGLLDTGEAYLSTNPGTLVELNASPWATITNSPATISCLVGQVVPTGSIVQGLPEV